VNGGVDAWETERLLARAPTPADRDAYRSHFTRVEIERWLRPPPLPRFDEELLGKLLLDDCRHWEQHGFGPWVLVERDSGQFVGRGGIAWASVEGETAIELPWSIEPRLHGKGVATEAALAAADFARELEFDEVIALTLPTNVASQRVAEKAGFRRAGECLHAGLPHVLFRMRLAPAAR
jgi:ribosomal-protein-alanine N-acetyltransferase